MSSYSSEMVLKENLRALRLPTILREYDACQRAAVEDGSSYVDFLSTLTTLEVQERITKRIKRRISEAQFPALKPLESFEMSKAPGLSAHLVRELAQGKYIDQQQNLILLGKSGSGKTHFATALAICACRSNYRVRFYTACNLVTELLEAREEYRLKQLMDRLNRYDLLVLDELGYVPFTKPGAELLFQILSERYERCSTIITTNLPFPDWVEIFGGATLTGALLDRITHHCRILEFNWASIRFQESIEQHHAQKESKKDSKKEDKKGKKDKNNQAAGGTPGN
jgi:DNA replication protein DnaC